MRALEIYCEHIDPALPPYALEWEAMINPKPAGQISRLWRLLIRLRSVEDIFTFCSSSVLWLVDTSIGRNGLNLFLAADRHLDDSDSLLQG